MYQATSSSIAISIPLRRRHMPSSFPVYDSVLHLDETGQADDVLDEGEGDASIFELCSQSSSNDTASNLPGSGRTIGLLYSRLGRALESTIGRLAHQSGFGPKAVASRIKRVGFKGVKVSGDDEPGREDRFRRFVHWTVRDGSEAKLYSDCRKLAKYATADIWETRFEALVQIIQLVTAEPRLRPFFNTPPILLDLKDVTRSSYISSRGSASKEDELVKHKWAVYYATQALLAIEDSPLNDIIEELLHMSFMHEDSQLLGLSKCKRIMTELIEHCYNPRYSFMAEVLRTRAMEWTNNFTASLQAGSEQYIQAVDLDETIELHRAILRLLDVHPERSLYLDNLANSLQIRFERHGQTADIDEAIEHRRTALRLLTEGHPDRPWTLDSLAISLRTRFERYGQTADIDEAIEHHRSALQLLPDNHRSLVVSLLVRFRQHRRITDINEAIGRHRASLQTLAKDCLWLCLLAVLLRIRYEWYGQIADIDEAIEHHRASLQLSDNDPLMLGCFAVSLRTRSERYEQTADIDEAIEYHRAALQLHSNDDPIRKKSLIAFAISLRTRFTQHGQTADIDEAVEHHCTTLQLLPKDDPERSSCLDELVVSLRTRFKQRRRIAGLNEVIEYYSTTLQL